MASFNKSIIMGNATRDPELRYLQSGTAVADMTLAVNERRNGPNGEKVEEVSFIDVTVWGRTAEIAGEYVKKGSCVLVEGRLKEERWEKDGQKRSKLKVVCEQLKLVGGKQDQSSGDDHGSQHDEQPQSGQSQPASRTYEDVPF